MTTLTNGGFSSWILALFVSLTLPCASGGQQPADLPVTATDRPAAVSASAPGGTAATHETTRGTFIDPLITEHAFVDRKVRWDLSGGILHGDEGELYTNTFIFEYGFTDWFSLELAQPLLASDLSSGASGQGLGDLSVAAKFQLTKAANTGGLILGAGVEFGLPSGEAKVGAGDEYVVAPLAALDWAIGTGLWKLQSQAEFEFAFPRAGGDGEFEAVEWNSALSFFRL